MSDLTATQLQALRWLEENDQNHSEWVNSKGRSPRKGEKWTHMRVSGPTGSVIMAEADQIVLRSYTEVVGSRTKFYRANEKGLHALGLPSRVPA